MAQVRFATLVEKGILARGMTLEIVPAALPADSASRDPRAYRASVGEPNSPRKSLIWELDGQYYATMNLTCRLWREFGVIYLPPSYYSHWRVVGREKSLWEEWKLICDQRPGDANGL